MRLAFLVVDTACQPISGAEVDIWHAAPDEIVNTQPLYNARGARDTTNENDSVVSASAAGDYTFQAVPEASQN